jgi:hypothetical protein
MGTVKSTISILLALFTLSCNAEVHSFKNASEEMLFRNFALSICIGMAYEGESEKLDSNVNSSASGYREFSNISLEAYEEARSVIQLWLKKNYKSKHGGQINLMKCIDLYNHDDLIEIFNKHNPCNAKDSWLDPDDFKLRCE